MLQGWKIGNSEQFIVFRIPEFQTNSKGKLVYIFKRFNFTLEMRIPDNRRVI